MNKRRRGLAVLMAISLIGLVAVALLAIGMLIDHDARRTIQGNSDAQLRQLLLAGGASALDHLGGPNDPAAPQRWSVPLPADLKDRGGTLEVRLEPGTSNASRAARVTAKVDGRVMSQSLRLERRDNRWRAVEAELEPSHPEHPSR